MDIKSLSGFIFILMNIGKKCVTSKLNLRYRGYYGRQRTKLNFKISESHC